jgi:membrane protein YdbS with pleckstrin-like domain
MDAAFEARIQAMLKRDILSGVAFVTTMWVTLIFTLFVALSVIPDATIKIVVGVACAILGVFNTLGMLSMIRRYKIESAHVYGEDLHHLDANRRAREARRGNAEVSAS